MTAIRAAWWRLLAAALVCLVRPGPTPSVLAQERPPAAPPVFRATTELVQVDAVVTDKDGRYVTDLTADDFEIVEDGEKRPISNFRYVALQPVPSAASVSLPESGTARDAAMARPPADVAAMAIVVDDFSLSFESTSRTRRLLYGVVDERLAAGELLAVLHTSGGLGNLQQFTTDKRLLHAAIDGLSANLAGRGRMEAAALKADLAAASRGEDAPQPRGPPSLDAFTTPQLEAFLANVNRARQVQLSLSTLTALERVVEGLARLPGRKSMLVLSEGFSFVGPDDIARVPDRLRELTDAANRAGVVIYTLDPGGLRTLLPQAADAAQTPPPPSEASARRRELRRGLDTLAEDTGGLAIADTNDLAGAVRRVVADRQGYYLLGYEPDAARFLTPDDKPRFHRIRVAVKRRGLRVRSRRAFYARPPADDDRPRAVSLADALLSPFVADDLPLRLTPLWSRDAKRGPIVRCLLHVDVRSMTLEEEADGTSKVELQALAVTFAATGRKGVQAGGTYTLRIPAGAVEPARRGGLAITLDLPAAPGPYQVRAAVRDVASGRTGSAAQFIELPDLKAGTPALTSIILSGVDAGPPPPPAGADAEAGTTAESAPDPDSTSAVRRFRRGAAVAYAFAVYNARLDPARHPSLAIAMSVYRDGVRVQTLAGAGSPPAVSPDGTVSIGGALRLGRDMKPGAYTLAVIVEDRLRSGKDRYAIQWAEFEVRPDA
jgi:VWFA-related protein